MQDVKQIADHCDVLATKAPWQKPEVEVIEVGDTHAKVSSPGENGIVTGPS